MTGDRRNLKILHVGDARSIHAARFVALLQQLGHDARLFHPSGEFFEDQVLSGAHVYVPYFNEFYTGRNRLFVTSPVPFEVKPRNAMQAPLRWLARRMNEKRHRVYDLVRVLHSFRPDIVISTKMQDEGYLVSEAKSLMGERFKIPWIHFVWGTDIEFFAKDDAYKIGHLTRVRRVLRSCDFLFSDSERDRRQARDFGFRGEHLGVFPAHGGFDTEWLAALRASLRGPRDLILVKGREGSHVGRAMNILLALSRLVDRLAGYRVVALLATPNVRSTIDALARVHSVPFEFVEYVPYDDLMRLYARSRLAISATTVDGMPSFLAEAMAMGALPIHSDMESIREWIDPGVNGLLFPVDDLAAIESAIIRGLEDDDLCRQAAEKNKQLIHARMNRSRVGREIDENLQRVVREYRPGSERVAS
jgi:glycosyltransferase involved in cell wall biosynthesis